MTTETAVRPSFFARHRLKLVLLGLLLAAALGVAGWVGATLAFSYSTGDRIGYVQKFSRRGWICRTWEGELAMNPVPGAVPQIFQFTVRDPALAARVAQGEGKQVALHYEEKRGVPSSCFGDTRYFVTDVRFISK